MKNYLLILFGALSCSTNIFAQEAPKIKFEKVSQEELTMKTYPKDTTAEAVILFDDGNSSVTYNRDKGFMLTYERFVRIKILKQSGVSWGNFNLSLYSSDRSKEEIGQLKGTTINLENGKAVKSDLKKDAIFHERENKYWESVRLSMPAVKVGSVIDLKYSITSDLLWNLRTWKFQYTIPVKWSQYRVIYPEYFTYNHSVMGYHPLTYSKTSQVSENINYVENIHYAANLRNGGGSETAYHTISYMAPVYEYAACNVPAIVEEPYITSLDNFSTHVKFELANTNFSRIGGSFKNYTTSWGEIAKQLGNEENFGEQLKGNNFAENIVEQITKGITDNRKKLDVVYSYVQHSMKWNGNKSVFTDKSLKKAYTDKTGNSGAINLLLTVMLNKAGITAYPVVLSTREHGILSLTHPTLSDCNYVIVQAVVDNKPILLDATEVNLQAGYIPFRCLNGEGHLIKQEESESVALSNPRSVDNSVIELEIKEGKLTGMLNRRFAGLSACYLRDKIKAAGGQEEYFKKLKSSSSEIDYIDYQYNKLDSLSLPLNSLHKISMKEDPDMEAEILYIDPVMVSRMKNNPFTSPKREYPVDFGMPFTEGYNMQFTIPKGYTVEELPKNQSFALENKDGVFLFQVLQSENKIIVNQRFTIEKTQFLPSEYQTLQKFYNQVINKQSEKIILKKTKI